VRGLDRWEYQIFKIGLFVVFVVTFGDYVFGKVWPVIGAVFGVK
jgi:hypothetical protein